MNAIIAAAVAALVIPVAALGAGVTTVRIRASVV